MHRILHFLRLAFLPVMAFCITVNAQNPVINEFMASNSSTIRDPEYNEYSDWIEVYNRDNQPINLKGYFITDNLNQPQKFKIVNDLIIPANGYVLIWADDKGSGNHANFKLSASGESIGISNPLGVLIDTLTFGEQFTDISSGRFPNGTGSFYLFSPATPGSINLESGLYNKLAEPLLNKPAGFYSTGIVVQVSHPDNQAVLRYTIDGRDPSEESLVYNTPLLIDTTIVLKVRAFKEGMTASNIVTSSYFINVQTSLPVFSLSTSPDNLFSDTMGIYVAGTRGITGNCSNTPKNWNQDWERPVQIEFFESNKNLEFKVNCGIKIFGGCSRIYPMKSLAFYFRSDYGFDKLNYKLFNSLPFTEYNNFILRSSGQDWWRTMFRDGMVHTILTEGTNLSVQAYRPSVVFINGQYWGIHNIREKINEHYIAEHFGVDKDSLDLVEYSKEISASNGDLTAYNQMIDYFKTHDLRVQSNYDYIKTILDIDDFLDYNIAQIFSANADWPGANSKLWRERKPGSKWRWLVYDLDFTFGGNSKGVYNFNTLEVATDSTSNEWPNFAWSTLMLRKLLTNTDFKNEFIQRTAAHINTTFRAERIHEVIDSLKGLISNEMPKHRLRWPKSITIGNNWEENIQLMKDFATLRPVSLRGFYNSKFGLAGSYAITISRNFPERGKVFTNSLEVKINNSQNVFFKNIPIKLKATANPGYHFVRWEGLSNSTSSEIEITGNVGGSLTAIFDIGSAVKEEETTVKDFALYQNYPNPFNPKTTISFSISNSGNTRLTVYNYLGEEIKTFIFSDLQKGFHEVEFDGSSLASGVYFYELINGNDKAVKKLVLMK